MDRESMSEFLTRRRNALQPADVGLPAGPRRRAIGLRREEVAQLAGMSTDYYTRLEQARSSRPSVQILASLSRALRLTLDERDYLYRAAGLDAPDRHSLGDYVSPALQRVLDRLTDTPAFIVSALGETLVQNEPAKALFGDSSHLTGFDRSETYRWFVHPATARRRYPEDDHDRQSRAHVASLRAAMGMMGQKSRAADLVHKLLNTSTEFEKLWAQHEVQRRFTDHKTLIHPELGAIEVDCQALFTEDESQALIVLTAAPRSEADSKLQLLRVLGSQQLTKKS